MFINAIVIQSILLFVITQSQIIEDDNETQSLIKPHSLQTTEKQKCTCLNNGQCYSLYSNMEALEAKKEVYCRCSNYFIGKQCELEAYPVSTTKEVLQKINIRGYKYFYFEPMEENMYSFTFELCLDYKTTKTLQDKTVNDTITFFLTTENQNGGILTNQEITKPVTLTIEPDQCKTITVDYTVLLITKVKTIQKLVLALKMGDKITPQLTKNDKEVDKEALKQKEIKEVEKEIKKDDKIQDTKLTDSTLQKTQSLPTSTQTQILPIKSQKILLDYHPISYTIDSTKKKAASQKQDETSKKQNIKSMNDFKSKSPSKLKQNDDSFSSRTISITFSVYPFMVEFVVFNILFSLTALAAFIIVGVMIFVIRSRILGIRITRSFGISSRLINDLSHFDRYISAEKFIKKERKQGDVSPNSSEIECAICLVKFENMDQIRRTPCSHSFHKSCIDTWCHDNLTCPMCRKSLTEKNLALYYNSTALELKNSPQSDQ